MTTKTIMYMIRTKNIHLSLRMHLFVAGFLQTLTHTYTHIYVFV